MVMKELSIEEKAKRYDEAINTTRNLVKAGLIYEDAAIQVFPELKESEDEKIKNFIFNELVCLRALDEKGTVRYNELTKAIDWVKKQGNNMGISEATKKKLENNLNKALEKETPESWNKFLDEQGEQKPVEPQQDMLSQEKYAKAVDECIYGEQKPTEWHREDEQNLNACLSYIPDAYLCRWLTDIIHVKYDKPTDRVKLKFKVGDTVKDPYGDLYHITEITDDSYKTDDGRFILFKNQEVYTLSNFTAWSEEDEETLNTIINHFKIDIECTDEDDIIKWLKSLKERYTWKPSDEQMKALREAVIEMGKSVSRCSIEEFHEIESLYNDLKKLKV